MKPTVALLVIDDGREDYLSRSLSSLQENLPTPDHFILVDDSAHELGFGGAIQEGWRRVLNTDAQWVFHAESDFTYTVPVPLARMIDVLEAFPFLAQVALKRQAVNTEERLAGGIVECHPSDFTEKRWGDYLWTEHRRYFTTNPSVYSTNICKRGWPQVKHSEGTLTHQLLADGLRFAFWGGKFGPPRVNHIGTDRAGTGY